MELTEVTDALKAIPTLNAILYPSAVLLGYVLRVCCGVFRSFDMAHTIMWAGIFGAVGAVLQLTRGTGVEWQEVVTQGIALSAGVFMVERMLNALAKAKSIPFLPRDNEWVKGYLPPAEEPPPRV